MNTHTDTFTFITMSRRRSLVTVTESEDARPHVSGGKVRTRYSKRLLMWREEVGGASEISNHDSCQSFRIGESTGSAAFILFTGKVLFLAFYEQHQDYGIPHTSLPQLELH